jgi:energy-coupling factor transporter ATP-binding protein EcfA2
MMENNGVETALSDFERKRLIEQIYIAFPRLNRVYSLVEHCHQHSKIAAEPECLLVTGRQGAGKTTLRRTYSRRYPRRATREGISVPVVRTENCILAMKSPLSDEAGPISPSN